jgi:hypothetical protein
MRDAIALMISHAAAVANGEATESSAQVYSSNAQKRFIKALQSKALKVLQQNQSLKVIKGSESGAWGVELLASLRCMD